MNLVDLYVNEIGRHLPAKNREDLKQEIRSLVEDAIDDAGEGGEVNENLVLDVLAKFGAPEKVAASYQPPRYLIGPNLFPSFFTVVRIVLPIVAILSAIGVGVSLGRTAADLSTVLRTIAEGVLGFLGSAATALGSIVLVYAIIQWLTPDLKIAQKEWDPRSLKAEPDPTQVKPGEPILEIFMNLALMLVANIYIRWIGITVYQNGQWLHAPILTEAFALYLPYINLVLVATIILQIVLLRHGSWTPALRWYSIALTIANIILNIWLLTGPAFIGVNANELIQLGWTAEMAAAFERAVPTLLLLFRMSLGITLTLQAVDLFKKIYRMLAPKISLPAAVL